MFDNLTGLGYGIITFAIVIGVGSILLYNFGGSVGCIDGTHTNWNSTSNLCVNPSNASDTASPTSTAYSNTNYLLGQMGQSGLAGWTPAIIAFSVGMLFLGAFMIRKGRRY